MVYATGVYKCTEEGTTEEGITGAEGGKLVIVRITNMYDMQSTIKKMGILGIHTPSTTAITSKYSGLFRNYKYMKVLSCDIRLACASLLPADPLQVGVEAGQVSPADMMNPLLYRAVSNDTWNTVMNRLYATGSGYSGDVVRAFPNAWTSSNVTDTMAANIYYALLADDGWRKAMPQSGLSMTGLRPLVYQVVNNFGNTGGIGQTTGNSATQLDNVSATAPGGSSTNVSTAQTIRGSAIPMPRIPTVGNETGLPNNVPKTFVACLVIPPADLTVMYYRLVVSWTIEFQDVRPISDWATLSEIANIGSSSHYSAWSVSASKDLEKIDEDDDVEEVGFVDALNMSPKLVMEK